MGGHAPDGCACAAVYLAAHARVVGGAGGAQHARVGGHRARGAGAALGGRARVESAPGRVAHARPSALPAAPRAVRARRPGGSRRVRATVAGAPAFRAAQGAPPCKELQQTRSPPPFGDRKPDDVKSVAL